MDTGAYMANQMNDLIESGIRMKDELDEQDMSSTYLVNEVGVFSWHKKKDFEETYNKWMGIKPESLRYLETLPKAYKIYEKLFGEPKTHAEWAERFNKVGEINRILMDNGDK